MAVECYIPTTYTPFPVVNSYIDVWKRTLGSIASYGICAEFAKLISRRAHNPGLSSVIQAARKYSNDTITLEKFEQVIAGADTGYAHDNYTATIGMLTAAVHRGCVEETVNIVIFIMCYWHEVKFSDAYTKLMRVIEKVNKEYRK